jgi:hypothetical protein
VTQAIAAQRISRLDCSRLTSHSRVAGTSFCRCGWATFSDDLNDEAICGFSHGHGRRCVKPVNHSGPHLIRLVKP